jgi:hypothetical protein
MSFSPSFLTHWSHLPVCYIGLFLQPFFQWIKNVFSTDFLIAFGIDQMSFFSHICIFLCSFVLLLFQRIFSMSNSPLFCTRKSLSLFTCPSVFSNVRLSFFFVSAHSFLLFLLTTSSNCPSSYVHFYFLFISLSVLSIGFPKCRC